MTSVVEGLRRRLPSKHAIGRVLLAGPGAFTTALLVDLGMALWLPQGAAGINQIAFPLLFLPLIWAALFFHACLDRSLSRVALIAVALSVLNGVAIAWHLATTKA